MSTSAAARNVLGTALLACSFDPLTGWQRDGCCSAADGDAGAHWVCARMTAEFLAFARERGNDLVTPRPQWRFVGLRPGDRWCLCAQRWKEALTAGIAPPVVLESTHERTLQIVPLEALQRHALVRNS
jgi:uncharacterized protein (DUF2237 family)